MTRQLRDRWRRVLRTWGCAKRDHVTFRDLEVIEGGYAYSPSEDELSSALGQWYDSIRNDNINGFSDFDIARSIRQRIFTDYVVPVALDRVEVEPLREDGDGEILRALRSLAPDVWASQPRLKARLDRLSSVQTPY